MRRTGLWWVRSVAVLACAVTAAVTACSPGEAFTPVPTQVLIPATATDTPTPITPTQTPPPLLDPQAVAATPRSADETPPVIDQRLVNLVLDDLAASLNISRDEIELIGLEAAVWQDVDLGCAGEFLPPVTLRIEGFRLLLRAEDTLYEYHTDKRTNIRRCSGQRADVAASSALVEVDPIAAELVSLAQRRIAQQLDLPTRRIRLISVVAMTWPDSSLGCPAAGQSYIPVSIKGYRIVLGVGEDRYIFHSDNERLIPCDPEGERLPGSEQTPQTGG